MDWVLTLSQYQGVSTSLARGWDSFTCIPASTTKSSGLNAPTTAVQPFLGFVESGFPFTHNGGAAPTRQAATGHNALFAQQIHFEVDLFARPIVGMSPEVLNGIGISLVMVGAANSDSARISFFGSTKGELAQKLDGGQDAAVGRRRLTQVPPNRAKWSPITRLTNSAWGVGTYYSSGNVAAYSQTIE
ncbi:hypothetical protein RND71_043831 [Anisodus tanguticus]|uniref:Uncharacterized protein n=1 Tax=Anisodus tanguticus TaxID=243964 RepID=A0AAE1QQS0_9SOLA|nr:hypothetical protein RND71_043831 [Anisodus tanguticus]